MAGLKKESVEFIAYLFRGSGKPMHQINNTPHLLHISERYNTMQVMSVTVILDAFEIYQISEQGWNKHFHQNMSVGCPTTQRYKMFGTNNTLWGIVNHKVAIFFSEKRYWFPIMLFPYSGITAYMNPPVAYKYGPYADLEAVYGVWRFYRNSYFIPPPIKIRSYG